MSDVLEQLARMFCEQDEFSPDDRIPTTDGSGNPCSYPRWREYLDQARRARAIVEQSA
jgi:hypothetical protein